MSDPMVSVWLKGWRDTRLMVDAINDPKHPMHEAAWPLHQRSFLPWQEGDAVYLAITYGCPDPGGVPYVDDLRICEAAFERFNIGTDDIAKLYRDAGHRSLSVGDVIEIERDDVVGKRRTAYTCDSFGWKQLEHFDPVHKES